MRHVKHTTFLAAATVLAIAAPASAQATKEVYLRAGVTTLTLPDAATVTAWGYALDSAAGTDDGILQVPGPVLALAPTDSTLVVHLKNRLPEATSIVVPGLQAVGAGAPTRAADGRALSLTGETAPGANGDYTFRARPGTFLYHSGSHIQVQVSMGLHGALKKDFAAGVPYDGAPAYDQDLVLVLSEIDPALNQAVASNQFGDGKAVTSAVNYAPRYFLVNGASFDPAAAPTAIAPSGKKTLLRLVNGAATTRVPTTLGQTFQILSDSGNLQPFPRTAYSVFLPALQTADVLLSPSTAGIVPLFDRGLGLSGGAGISGGMEVRLAVAAPAPVLKRFQGTRSAKMGLRAKSTRTLRFAPSTQRFR